jgi:hypothetical protein
VVGRQAGLGQSTPHRHGRRQRWVHAYLHRSEGDLDNARYWYRRAQRPVATMPLDAEWDAIAQVLLAVGTCRS